MAIAIHVPRINNNDDEVKLVGLDTAIGQRVTKGQVLAQVETDKAVVEVEAQVDGYVLSIRAELESVIRVGSVLIWLGESLDTPVPTENENAENSIGGSGSAPTAKAKALLSLYGLNASEVPASGMRLSVADVERHVALRGLTPHGTVPATGVAPAEHPEISGARVALTPEERGMLATVTWHRDVAVPGYIEISYDQAPWEAFAKAYGEQHKLLLNPLLPLMAWRLVELAQEKPRLNASIIDRERIEYHDVNLGFTVQAGDILYLTVMRNAGRMDQLDFVNGMIDIQRRAAAHKLTAQETQGATIAFSSMARWKVNRHIPILSPNTAIMIAHTTTPSGECILGASYDHRVLNGADVVVMLRKLAKPSTN